MSAAGNKAVFLSYASQDAEAARRICDTLRAAGVEVWFDQSELRGGDAWDQKIRRQIKECALFVPVISANTQARREGYFRLEWRLADQRTHLMSHDTPFILPVVIDETRDHDARVPESFLAVQWTRLAGGQVGSTFCERVKALLSGGDGSPRESRGDVERAVPSSSGGGGFGEKSPPGKRPRVLLLLSVAAVAVALIAFALRQTWKSPQPISPRSDTSQRDKQSAEISPPPERAASPAVTALLTRARELVAKTDVARSDLDTAAGLLEQAAKQEPTNARVWAERSLVDWRYLTENLDRSMARLDSARRHAAQAIGLEPENPLARLAQAAAMTAVQRDPATKQRAIHLLEPVVNRITDRADGLYLLASLQSIDRALELLDRAAQRAGEAGRAETNRSRIFWVAGRMIEADEAADRALAAERSTRALLGKAYFLTVWHGETAEAQRLLAEVPSEVWGEDFAASARYFMELWAGNPDRALAAMSAVPREFIESYALSGPTGYYRGYALARANKPAAAAAEWRSALAVVQRELASRPNDQTLLTFSALLHWSLGDRTAALQVWQSLRELTGGRLISWENYFLQMTILPEEEAIAQLESLPPSDVLIVAANLRLNPYLDRLRSHPRFVALQARSDADPRSSPRAARSAPMSAKSVAVLAFDNLSDDKANEYFSDGISEELLNVLAKVPGLRVTARTSAFSFKGKGTPIPEIGRQLGVAYVVEGSVRKSGSQVRIAARLIKASEGTSLWAEEFREELKDVWALQDKIAGVVAEKLQLTLGGAPRTARAVNPEAHSLLLEGRYFWNLRGAENLARAETAFLAAVKLDATFAQPHAGLADVYLIRAWYSQLEGRMAEAAPDIAQARQKATEAMRLDDSLPEPHAALGTVHFLEGEFVGAERAFARSFQNNPNHAVARHWHSIVQGMQGRLDVAWEQSRDSALTDPRSPNTLWSLATIYNYARRHEDAAIEAERSLVLRPGFLPALAEKAVACWFLGRKEEALAAARAIARDRNSTIRWWADPAAIFILRLAGRDAEAEEVVGHIRATASPGDYRRAFAVAALGRWDEAFAATAQVPTTAWGCVFYHRLWDEGRGDPRFQQMIERMGCAEQYQLARASLERLADRTKK